MLRLQLYSNVGMKLLILALVASVSVTQDVSKPHKPTYTVVAPAKIRPNSNYHVSVSVHDSPNPIEVDLTISGPSDTGAFNTVSKTVVVNGAETRIMNFEIGEWTKGNYKLIVKGRGGYEFTNETSLQFEQKSYSVFIQTDKAIYKPGQLVQFRAIIVNPYLRPTVLGALDMHIKDSKGNRVKQWNRVFTSRGVVSAELQLSEQPVLGDWTITVEVLGQKFQKSFTIAEYVLPTFDVEVKLPPYATYNKSDVIATIKATYTYGKPVKGEVTLTVQPKVRYNVLAVRPLEQFQTKTTIDGSVDIPVNIVRDLNLKTDFFEREIEFFALVEEGLTGRKYNKSNTVKIHDKEVKVELIKTSKTFKPGLKYTAYLKVAYQDDIPVDDNGPPLKLRYGYSYSDEQWTNVMMLTPVKGMIKIEIYPPRDKDAFVLGMRAEYKGQTYFLENVESAQSPSNNFIQVVMSDQRNPRVEQEVRFEVNATEPLNRLIFEVMGRGDIVLARSVDVPNTNTFQLNFMVTHHMAPKARIVVYYVRSDNQEVVADALNFDVDGVFKTQVTIDTNVQQTTPGSSVDVRIETTPHAYVGVLGIDQSILLLKSGNDITQQEVIDELETYDTGKTNRYGRPWMNRRKRSIYWWPGSTTTGEIFDDSGVVVMSNGLIHRNFQWSYYQVDELMPAGGLLDVPMSSSNSIRTDSMEKESSDSKLHEMHVIRKFFPETWIMILIQAEYGEYDDVELDTLDTQGGEGDGLRVSPQMAEAMTISEKFHDTEETNSKPQEMHVIRKYFPETWLFISTHSGMSPETLFNAPAMGFSGGFGGSASVVDSSASAPLPLIPANNVQQIRKDFPETWLWNSTIAGPNGHTTITSSIPDTITSWIVTAFAMDQITGLGISQHPAKVTVFRPFFIKMSLPYSLIRGESVAIQAIVFNYLDKPMEAEVIMDNRKGEFEFTDAANEIENSGNTKVLQKRKYVNVPANDGVSVSFLITPLKVGYIEIKLTASSTAAGDSVLQKLLVKPEGQPQHFNKAVLIDLRDPNRSDPVKRNVSIAIPNNSIPGSERVTVSGIGDILGPTINNLDDLLRMPYGCGEQNMINFVPNIVILDYLSRANRLTPSIKSKAIAHIESGYQRELTYKRDDGSYSAFGNNDKSGSTWLTAFVVKSFIQAKPYVEIDQKVINKSIEWLLSRQTSDGGFSEPGEVHNKALQGGGSSGSGALSAYVLIALAQDKDVKRNKRSEISRAENYIWNEFGTTRDPYNLAIIAYALHAVESTYKDNAYNRLMSYAKNTEDYKWWTNIDDAQNNTDKHSAHFFYPKSNDVEMTAYALLTMLMRSDIENALPVLKWLISQQNSNGGFSSTQDTVIGIQALGTLAQRISTTTVSLNVKYNYKAEDSEDKSKTMRIDSNNAMVLQRIEMPISTKYIEVEATGFGAAIVQVSWQYNLAVSAEQPAFFLNPQNDKTSTENYLQLSVCTYYKSGNSTNMAVMEVELPSGYVADVDALPSVTRSKEVKRIDTTNGDTNVIIYFDRITRNEVCMTVPAHRTHKVANHKPVPVTVYDYYDRSQTARIFYEPRQSNICDICEGDECSKKCKDFYTTKNSPSFGENSQSEGSSATSVRLAFTILPMASKVILLNLVKHILAFTVFN